MASIGGIGIMKKAKKKYLRKKRIIRRENHRPILLYLRFMSTFDDYSSLTPIWQTPKKCDWGAQPTMAPLLVITQS